MSGRGGGGGGGGGRGEGVREGSVSTKPSYMSFSVGWEGCL